MKLKWQTKKLGEICDHTESVDPKKHFKSKTFGYIDLSSTQQHGESDIIAKEIYTTKAPSRARKLVRTGDIIFATTRPSLKHIAPIPDMLDGAVASTGFCVIRPKKNILDSEYCYYLVMSDFFVNQVVLRQRGVSYPAVSDKDVFNIEILLPPIEEQKKIVEKLEKVLGKVKEAKRLRAEAENLSASLLSAELHKIFSFGNWPEGGFIDLTDSKDKGAIKPGPFGSSLRKSFYVKKGYKIYGQEQVISGDAFFGAYYIDQKKYEELKAFRVAAGDVLISLVGTIGRVLILPENFEKGVINPRLLKITPDKMKADSKFIAYLLRSSLVLDQIARKRHGGTMSILNKGILESIRIKIPPLAEQKKIVVRLDSLSAKIRKLQEYQKSTASDLVALEQAILSKAFNS